MDWTLVYGFLIGIGLFIVIWFAFVAPSERRDHQRRLELVQKRLAEREVMLRDENEPRQDAGESADRDDESR
ncbi:MAG: hypothetical protein U5K76_12010 [Woeseiaceae bacterium]|nr:hypothetical protein [Woeseiaceae bacterium]